MVDSDRLLAAYETARLDLLAETEPAGHWTGSLSSSPLSTATAISALAIVERHAALTQNGRLVDEPHERWISELIVRGLHWLAQHQNADGGWGDTDKSLSNIATTMLARAAFQLTAVPAKFTGLIDRADAYIRKQGGVCALERRYGRDKTFAAPILTNCALAGMIPWRQVPSLPFELAAVPQKFWNRVRMPVVSYAVPALVAIGQAKFHHRKPLNPFSRLIRSRVAARTLKLVEQIQPASGGFLEATPLTSFVVMSLASMNLANHPVVRRGVQFLLASVRADGSWPIDTNLATWNTTLSVNALAGGGENVSELPCWDWLLRCQHLETHPYTGAAAGGWAWTDLSGGVPDVDDTSGALLAIAHRYQQASGEPSTQMLTAAKRGIGWLLDLQNGDGGWPTFCRGWGTLPFDRSGADLTAHALRAIQVWRKPLSQALSDADEQKALDTRIDRAVERGLAYLIKEQRPDGSWLPLWFGNQHQADESNPIYGTARVLLAFRELGRLDTVVARKGLDWLSKAQNKDGGWGGHCQGSGAKTKCFSSIEESALAVETLVSCGRAAVHERAASQGLIWLTNAVEANRHHECSPIGFYFAKLWYYEKLYPLIFTVAALGQAIRLEAARRPGLRGVSMDSAASNGVPLNSISLHAVPLPATKAAVEVRVAK